MRDMPAGCVVDASVAIKLFLPEQHSDQAQELFEQWLAHPEMELFVPDLLYAECANVLWKKMRRGEYDAERAASDLADLRGMALATTSNSELMERALDIAHAFDITTYDACYVALAELKKVPLVTADERLADKLEGTDHETITLCQLT